jgi:hypothetical protein
MISEEVVIADALEAFALTVIVASFEFTVSWGIELDSVLYS